MNAFDQVIRLDFFGTAMIIARCHLDPGAIETIPQVIPELPEAIRPTHFGESEDKKDPRFPLSGVGARGALEQLAHSGYLLFAADTIYSLTPATRGYAELFVSNEHSLLSTDDLYDLMRNLVDHGLKFGLIAECEEYIHRNQYVHPLPSRQVQAWVGRDLSKYLPGLHWTNILSIEVAKKYHIADSALPVNSKAVEFGRSHFACRLFNRPGGLGQLLRPNRHLLRE